MKGALLLAVATALAASGAAAAAPKSCPGPGCLPLGSFTIPLPARGKVAFYVVKISGKGTGAPVVGASLNNTGLSGLEEMAAFAPKPTVKNGTVTISFYIGIANPKSKLKYAVRGAASARGAGIDMEAFSDPGLTNPGVPTVTEDPAAEFKSSDQALSKNSVWNQFYEGQSVNGVTFEEILDEFLAAQH